MKKNRISKIRILKISLGGLTTLMLCIMFLSNVFAYGAINTQAETSLKLECEHSGVAFSLYRVGDVSQYGEFTLSGDFSGYAVDLSTIESDSDWLVQSETLAGLTARDQLTPLESGATNENGSLTFSELSVGLYLVVGASYEKSEYIYTPAPFIVCLPSLDNKTDSWVYDVVSEVKVSRQNHGDDVSDLTVVKEWKNEKDKAKRPEEIVVQLLLDGAKYDEVTLNEKNGWHHTWKDMDKQGRWQVTEKQVPSGYTVTVSQKGTTFTVTNSGKGSTGPDPGGSKDSKLPQTGQLWWPVPLLALIGILLFSVGWIRRRGRDERSE